MQLQPEILSDSISHDISQYVSMWALCYKLYLECTCVFFFMIRGSFMWELVWSAWRGCYCSGDPEWKSRLKVEGWQTDSKSSGVNRSLLLFIWTSVCLCVLPCLSSILSSEVMNVWCHQWTPGVPEAPASFDRQVWQCSSLSLCSGSSICCERVFVCLLTLLL